MTNRHHKLETEFGKDVDLMGAAFLAALTHYHDKPFKNMLGQATKFKGSTHKFIGEQVLGLFNLYQAALSKYDNEQNMKKITESTSI